MSGALGTTLTYRFLPSPVRVQPRFALSGFGLPGRGPETPFRGGVLRS